MKLTNLKSILAITIFTAIFASCSSSPKEIPEDLTAQELIQKGQDAFERRKYKESLRYYNTVIERHSNATTQYLEANYEIGHLFMKQKKYDQAKTVFEQLISYYDNSIPGSLPGAYYKLAQNEMEKIKEKQASKEEEDL